MCLINSEIMDKIKNIILELRQGNTRNVYIEIKEQMPVINSIFIQIIKDINIIKEYGIDVSEKVILMQLSNMIDGLENRDIIKLADTLEYEIYNTMEVYNEVLKEKISSEVNING